MKWSVNTCSKDFNRWTTFPSSTRTKQTRQKGVDNSTPFVIDTIYSNLLGSWSCEKQRGWFINSIHKQPGYCFRYSTHDNFTTTLPQKMTGGGHYISLASGLTYGMSRIASSHHFKGVKHLCSTCVIRSHNLQRKNHAPLNFCGELPTTNN